MMALHIHTYISYSAFEEARNTVTLEEGEWRSGKLHSGGIKNRNLGQVCIVHVPFWRQNINIKLYYLLDIWPGKGVHISRCYQIIVFS